MSCCTSGSITQVGVCAFMKPKERLGGLWSSSGFQVVWQADPRLCVDHSISTVPLHELTTNVDQRTDPFRFALESRIQEKPAQEKGNHYCYFQERSQSGCHGVELLESVGLCRQGI